jgi:hypothetical protein
MSRSKDYFHFRLMAERFIMSLLEKIDFKGAEAFLAEK